MSSNKIKILLISVISILFLISINSCTRKVGIEKSENASHAISQMTEIPENNFNESDTDLFSVNYKEIYDELSPHGKWIQVSAKDVGLDSVYKGLASGEIADKKTFLSEVFGIKTARADEDVDFGMFFVWQPDPSLAVSVVAGEPPVYQPYSDGQWVYTDDGWYFDAPTPYEEITVHYGRWVYSPFSGWVWVPGRVWAPAWVDWYEDDDYIAWVPIPPRVYFVDDDLTFPPYCYVDNDRYFFCEKQHFCDPDVYKYRIFENDHGERFNIREFNRGDGLVVKDNKIINRGPNVGDIQKHWGQNISPVNVTNVRDKNEAGYSGNQMKSYSPQFSRFQNTQNRQSPAYHPNSYTNLEHKSQLKGNKNLVDKGNNSSGNKHSDGNQPGGHNGNIRKNNPDKPNYSQGNNKPNYSNRNNHLNYNKSGNYNGGDKSSRNQKNQNGVQKKYGTRNNQGNYNNGNSYKGNNNTKGNNNRNNDVYRNNPSNGNNYNKQNNSNKTKENSQPQGKRNNK